MRSVSSLAADLDPGQEGVERREHPIRSEERRDGLEAHVLLDLITVGGAGRGGTHTRIMGGGTSTP